MTRTNLNRRGFLKCSIEGAAALAGARAALGAIPSWASEIDDAAAPADGPRDMETYRLKPLPAPLQKVRGVHPRIYLTADRISELREAIKTTHAGLWDRLREQADQAVRAGAPAYNPSGWYEQTWQREVGNTMPVLAMAYVLSGRRQYLAAVCQWATASCGYKTWGRDQLDGMDLATGHQLFGLALVYDWCYHDLDEPTRRLIRETLVRRASAMCAAAAGGKTYWYRSYLQNHLWVNVTGMAACGLALFDEADESALWLGLALDKFRRTMESLGPDGASHEGVGYWGYGVEYMMKFMDPARTYLDVNFYEHPWWRNTAAYAQYMSLPRNAWSRNNCIVDLADCLRCHWYGPDYLLRGLARTFRDGHAQWLAAHVQQAGVALTSSSWLNLVWYDASLPSQPPDDLPTLRHFSDTGIVSARTGWSGDESLVVFKSGPFLGHHAMDRFTYDPGGSHAHPDANHFVLFGAGRWLLCDDGYQHSGKWTNRHNTLLVAGRGQVGEGHQWFAGDEALAQKATARVLRAVSTPTLDHIVGDATEAYPRELGLRRFVRHLLFWKPDVLIVADEILLDEARPLELRFHPEWQAYRDGDAFVSKGEEALLRLEALTAEGVEMSADLLPGTRDDKSSIPTIHLSTQRRQWRNAVALSWAPVEKPPPSPARVSLRAEGDSWQFSAGDRTVTLDWTTGRVESPQPEG